VLPDFEMTAAEIVDAVDAGRMNFGALSRAQRLSYQIERDRRAAEQTAAEDDRRDAGKRAAEKQAAEKSGDGKKRRAATQQPVRRQQGGRPDIEFLREFSTRQAFAAVAVLVAGLVSAVFNRRPTEPQPTTPAAPQYSVAEIREARAEMRLRARALTELLQSVPTSSQPSASYVIRSLIAYLDFKISGEIPKRVGVVNLYDAPFSCIGRPLFAAANAADYAQGVQWRDALWTALHKNGDAGRRRLLRQIESVGAEIMESYPALGQVMPGPLPMLKPKTDGEAETIITASVPEPGFGP
jgi:hypothetical protein